jgi:hypothetical protein
MEGETMIRQRINFNGTKGAGVLVAASLLVFGSTAAVAAPDDERAGELSLVAAPNVPMAGLLPTLPDHARAIERGEARRPDAQAPGGGGCDKEIDVGDTVDSEIAAARVVGAVDTDICTNSDIDTYSDGTSTYVVIAGGTENAWTQIDVTDPANPTITHQASWAGRAGKGTYTPDVKTFKQTIGAVTKYYLALGLERTKLTGACGVVIVDVTTPTSPDVVFQYSGSDWCDTHNVFVEDDASGNGIYIYATADATADLRVLSISGGDSVAAPVEQGVYRRTDSKAATDSNTFDDVYVHDVTVQDEVVYASYWGGGLNIFDAIEIRGDGQTPADIVSEATPGVADVIAPTFASSNPFLVHHAYPSPDGGLVFVEDEITYVEGDEPVQMFNTTTTPISKQDGLVIDDLSGDVPVYPAHNLEVSGNRLYVGWYQAGLQAWDFDVKGFVGVDSAPRTADVYHQAQVKDSDDAYDGAWGVRVLSLDAIPDGGRSAATSTFAFQSDREFGLIIDCLGDGNGDLANCPAQLVLDGGGEDEKECNPRSPNCN